MKKILSSLALLLPTITVAAPGFVPVWAARDATQGHESSHVVVDAAGNSYTARTAGMTKRDVNGRLVWSTRLPGGNYDYIVGLAIDSQGNSYLAGQRFNVGNATNFSDALVLKVDAQGQWAWQRELDGPDTYEDANGIGVDSAGRVYLVGRSYPAYAGHLTNFHLVASFDVDGNQRWVHRTPAALGGAVNLGTFAVNPHGGVAAITSHSIASYSAEGDLLWTWRADGSFTGAVDDTDFLPATFDKNDQLLLAGTVPGTWEPTAGVRKFSPTGEVLWTTAYARPAQTTGAPRELRVDAAGNAYLGLDSSLSCRTVWDDEEVSLLCNSRPAVVKFGPDGDILWASRFLGNPRFYYYFDGLTVDVAGRVTLSSRVYRTVGALGVDRPDQIFLGQCDTDGTQIRSSYYRRTSVVRLWSSRLQTDAQTNLYVPVTISAVRRGQHEIVYGHEPLLVRFRSVPARRAPRMYFPPQPQTAPVGGRTYFVTIAVAPTRLHYQWRLNSVPIPGATSQILLLENLRPEQAGEYSVEIRGSGGTIVSAEARLTITPAPAP